jgi:hypothetical protein
MAQLMLTHTTSSADPLGSRVHSIDTNARDILLVYTDEIIILDAESNFGVFREFQTRVMRNLGFRLSSLFLILENPDSLGLRKSMF